ncbi:MAG: c-type cytochrome biogenesis protein CcmI [Henriciella sp.]
MIWFILGVFLLCLLLFVLTPLLREAPATGSSALETARAQLARLESDLAEGRIGAETAAQTRSALEQRVLELLQDREKTSGGSEQSIRIARMVAPIVLCVGGIGLYMFLGEPDYRADPVSDPEILTAGDLEGQSLEELVAQLEQRLASDPDAPAMGYILLARSMMRLQRYNDAIRAYEMAVSRPDAVAEMSDELAEARAFIEAGGANGMPMLDQETIDRVQAMSAEDQAAIIEGMVAGLAARLEAEPGDITGWVRLIRARMVLGDTAQAELDFAAAMAAAEGNSEAQADLRELAADAGLNIAE